jgi:hypothetical protein
MQHAEISARSVIASLVVADFPESWSDSDGAIGYGMSESNQLCEGIRKNGGAV